ncbi:hypothetical protein TNCT_511671 [Trichonephila clavata]|uniref:MBD domain-containing protein n=1 Tax=Trichonephila clavata TaxID=2740835 RepID=A0A8X6J8I3_TRICU|nr:hypothetical protein TNCT_511671 [Trichonephila clavata]
MLKDPINMEKRCQSPTRQRQSRNNQTPNQRNNFHHRDISPEAVDSISKSHTVGAVLEPVYLKFEPFEPFPGEVSRHERIVKDASDKSSVATPESSEDETDEDSPDTHKPSTKTVNWLRKLVPRPDGSRTDVYYYQEGCTKRLRTLKDIEKIL